MQQKQCTKCGETKDVGQYYKSNSGRYGVMSICKFCDKKRNQKWMQENADKNRANTKVWREENPEKAQAATIKYHRKRRANDQSFRLVDNLRRRMRLALNGKKKSNKSFDLIGCTPEFLKEHLESKFESGMTWDNYGLHGWHVDHIRPCASFDLSDPEQQKVCFHYSNLQPLWAKDNLNKRFDD